MSGMSVIMVDADPGAAGIIRQALEKHDISVSCHSNGRDSLRELQSGRHHWAMLIELSLPDMDGIELLREARRILPHLPCLILSERDQAEPAVHAMKAGAEDYFTKPIDIPRLLNALRGAIAMVPGAQEGEQVKYLSAVEGRWKSAAMKNAHDLALRAAVTDRPVALTGPANSGRNAMARFIHAHSKSAADPFHSLDLAARTSRQVEIELFGVDLLECEHPVPQTKGRLNRPGKGTLHLDHIEMLRPCAQQALWQRLVGSKAPQPGSPVLRLIATTSADMRGLIARGAFRKDLWYALSVHHIEVPALAQRVKDLPQLCEDIITSICVNRHLRRPKLTRKALEAITEHTWPGNLAELQSALEHAVTTTADGLISPSNLPRLVNPPTQPAAATPATMAVSSIDEITRTALMAALDASHGNRRRTAQRLKVSLRTVYNMIQRYELKGYPNDQNTEPGS